MEKIILEVDGASDIFKAKEILGDRICIMGDVPVYLLAFSEKGEVLDYCKPCMKPLRNVGIIDFFPHRKPDKMKELILGPLFTRPSSLWKSNSNQPPTIDILLP